MVSPGNKMTSWCDDDALGQGRECGHTDTRRLVFGVRYRRRESGVWKPAD